MKRLMSLLPDAVDLTPIFPWIGERTMNDHKGIISADLLKAPRHVLLEQWLVIMGQVEREVRPDAGAACGGLHAAPASGILFRPAG